MQTLQKLACHNLLVSRPIILKFCTEHDNITAMLSAKFEKLLENELGVTDKKEFARFTFKVSFR